MNSRFSFLDPEERRVRKILFRLWLLVLDVWSKVMVLEFARLTMPVVGPAGCHTGGVIHVDGETLFFASFH